jgi:hypothetical protein
VQRKKSSSILAALIKNDKNMSPLHLAQLELAADRSSSRQSRGPEHEKQVQSVIDLLVAAGALPDRPDPQ